MILSRCMIFFKHDILVLMFLTISIASMAQSADSLSEVPQRSPEDIAEYQTFMLQKDLQLTDEQVELVYQVNLKYVQLGRPISRQQAEERMNRKLSDLKAILTEQQYNLFVKKTSEIKHSRGGMKLQRMTVERADSIDNRQPSTKD